MAWPRGEHGQADAFVLSRALTVPRPQATNRTRFVLLRRTMPQHR